MEVVNGYNVVRNVDRAVFTGDTIFSGGCGRFLEGNAEQMVYAMSVAKDKLPQDTKMFPGHEYTVANMSFCAKVD
jgi:hydroxyacylglutathione hydrolase